MKKYLVLLIGIVILSGFFSACSTNTQSEAETQKRQMDDDFKKYFPNDDPQNHIDDVRQYALDKLELDDETTALVKNTTPKIKRDPHTMEYCFFWVLTEKNKILQVIVTPPPSCDPLDAKITDKVTYIW